MAPDERVAFEALLRTDGALGEDVRLHADVHHVVGDTRREEFLQTLASAGHDYFSQQVQVGKGRLQQWYWRAAAAVVLLAAVGVFLLVPGRKSAPEDLFTAYFE